MWLVKKYFIISPTYFTEWSFKNVFQLQLFAKFSSIYDYNGFINVLHLAKIILIYTFFRIQFLCQWRRDMDVFKQLPELLFHTWVSPKDPICPENSVTCATATKNKQTEKPFAPALYLTPGQLILIHVAHTYSVCEGMLQGTRVQVLRWCQTSNRCNNMTWQYTFHILTTYPQWYNIQHVPFHAQHQRQLQQQQQQQ